MEMDPIQKSMTDKTTKKCHSTSISSIPTIISSSVMHSSFHAASQRLTTLLRDKSMDSDPDNQHEADNKQKCTTSMSLKSKNDQELRDDVTVLVGDAEIHQEKVTIRTSITNVQSNWNDNKLSQDNEKNSFNNFRLSNLSSRGKNDPIKYPDFVKNWKGDVDSQGLSNYILTVILAVPDHGMSLSTHEITKILSFQCPVVPKTIADVFDIYKWTKTWVEKGLHLNNSLQFYLTKYNEFKRWKMDLVSSTTHKRSVINDISPNQSHSVTNSSDQTKLITTGIAKTPSQDIVVGEQDDNNVFDLSGDALIMALEDTVDAFGEDLPSYDENIMMEPPNKKTKYLILQRVSINKTLTKTEDSISLNITEKRISQENIPAHQCNDDVVKITSLPRNEELRTVNEMLINPNSANNNKNLLYDVASIPDHQKTIESNQSDHCKEVMLNLRTETPTLHLTPPNNQCPKLTDPTSCSASLSSRLLDSSSTLIHIPKAKFVLPFYVPQFIVYRYFCYGIVSYVRTPINKLGNSVDSHFVTKSNDQCPDQQLSSVTISKEVYNPIYHIGEFQSYLKKITNQFNNPEHQRSSYITEKEFYELMNLGCPLVPITVNHLEALLDWTTNWIANTNFIFPTPQQFDSNLITKMMHSKLLTLSGYIVYRNSIYPEGQQMSCLEIVKDK